MRRGAAFGAACLGVFVAATNASSCVLFESFSITETGGTGGTGTSSSSTKSSATNTSSSASASSTGDGTTSSSTNSATAGVSSSGTGGACSCTNLVSAYLFSNPGNLGQDLQAVNNFTDVTGTPTQSTTTPPGMPGHSVSLDGSSSLCMPSGFTFDSTQDHTLCWWARPAALSDSTNQFAQTCSYDTWTQNGGKDYLWRTNNCNGGTPIDLVVPNVYAVNQWVQICQTYTASAIKREIVINGVTSQKTAHFDSDPILEPGNQSWCIGSYGGGGYWNGLIYLPLWFDKVLSDAEIQDVYANGCCLQ